jgi:hypothetical protein
MIKLLLVLSLIIKNLKSAITCHSDCAPNMCHGNSMYTCTKCGPNMKFRGSLCACKPGWFDLNGRCNYNLPFCVEAQKDGAGILQCTKCETSRDDLLNGQCTRSSKPFFIRSGDSFTGSANNKLDIDWFFSNLCKTIGTTKVCQDCHPNSYLNGDKCIANDWCEEISPTNSSVCTVPAKGTYFKDKSLVCAEGCRACGGPAPRDCLSCNPYFYFTRNSPELTLGTCKACFSDLCLSCSGPGANDCFLPKNGYYIDSSSGTNEIKKCPDGCDKCESATNCTLCRDKISLNGVCTSQAPIISNCRYQINSTSTDGKCLKYKNGFLTGTNGQPYATNFPNIPYWSNCLIEGQTEWSDRISSVCLECIADKILKNDFCRVIFNTVGTENCANTKKFVVSENLSLCYQCINGFTRLPNGSCALDCSEQITGMPVTNFTELDGSKSCLPCSSGCLQCQQDGDSTACTLCTSDKVLFDGKCMSKSCGDGILSENKQCDPNQLFVPEKPCSADCLYFSSDCPNNDGCFRNLFQLKASNEENVINLEINTNYTQFYTYEFRNGVTIRDVNLNTQQILCGMVLPDLDDPLSKCYFIKAVDGGNATTANSIVRIETTSRIMAKLQKQNLTVLNNGSIIVQRKFMSGLTAEQSITKAAGIIPVVNFVNAVIAPVIAVASPRKAISLVDYHLSYLILQPGSEILSSQWNVTECKVAGVIDSSKQEQINLALASQATIIPANLLNTEMTLEIEIKVTYADGINQKAPGSITISSSPNFFQLLDSPTLVVNTKESVTILLSYTAATLLESEIVVTSGNVQLISGQDYRAKVFSATKRVLITVFVPAAGVIEVNLDGGAYTPVSIRLISSLFAEQVSLIVPEKIGRNQEISFWTNVGSNFQYQIFAFSQSSNQNLFSTVAAQSDYKNYLTEKLTLATAGEQVVLYFMFFTNTYQAFYQRTLTVTENDSLILSSVIPGTAFRDGSNLQSSKDKITFGVYRFLKGSTTAPVSTTHHLISNSAGQLVSSNSDLSISKVSYGLQMSPSLAAPTSSSAASTSFSLNFASPTETSVSCFLKLFNEPESSVTAVHLTSVSVTAAVFEVLVQSSQPVNQWNAFASPQFVQGLLVSHGLPAALQPQFYWPIYLPASGRYSYLELPERIFTKFSTVDSRPTVSVQTFDFNKHVTSSGQPLSVSASWTPAELPVSTYITTLNNSLAAATDSDLLRQLNLAVFTCNQAFLSCKFGGSCLPEDEPIRNMREMLWLQFNTFWSSVPDKDAYQDWTTSVLKSSFLGALTLTGEGVTDATIGQIETEMIRDVTSLTQSITTTIAGLSRTHYKIGESLKAVLKVTLQNLELLINTYSHLLRLYGFYYKGFTDVASYQTKMNDVYLKTIILNEAKLLRYTMPTDITTFENELILMGGSTILSP